VAGVLVASSVLSVVIAREQAVSSAQKQVLRVVEGQLQRGMTKAECVAVLRRNGLDPRPLPGHEPKLSYLLLTRVDGFILFIPQYEVYLSFYHSRYTDAACTEHILLDERACGV
jgi:hypothetical protein